MRRLIPVLFFAAICSGCIHATTLITLKPDGSGTIDQEMAMKAETLAMLRNFAQAGDKDKDKAAGKDIGADLFTEEQAKKMAADMGVTFVSGAPFKTGELEGYRAKYSFADIRTLKMKMDQQTSQMNASAAGSPSETPFGFDFNRGAASSVLTIRMPDQSKNQLSQLPIGGAGTDAKENEQAMAMMKTMLGGMYFDVSLAIDGKILKSNAPFVNGGRVTLIQMDFDKMMANPEAFQKMQQAKDLAGLQNVPGLKVVSTPTVTIEFTK
jgi:hypothetical protein